MFFNAKFVKRVTENTKKYQSIVSQIKKKDANESDTVTVIIDILSDVFGYDKYSEITSEYAIHGTYCDLAIVGANKKIRFLLEVKAISVALNDRHVKQAIDYGSNAGVNWVILTNAERWLIYKIKFGQPIDKELVYEFNLLDFTGKTDKDFEAIFAISKEGQEDSVIDDFYTNMQIKNKFIIGSLLNSEEIYTVIRRTMKKLFNDIKITDEEIADMMANDIIKREIIDSDESKKAKKDIEKMYKKLEKMKEKAKENVSNTSSFENKNEPTESKVIIE